MKRWSGILFLLVLTAGFTSAAQYECLNGSIYQDSEEIEEYSARSVGGISVGVTYADFAAGINRAVADLLIDAKKVSLMNGTNGTLVELKSGEYSLELISATNELAKIKEGSSTNEIEVGETEKIGGLYVYLIESSQSPLRADLVAGMDKMSLEVISMSIGLINVQEEDYLVELLSASDNDVLIRVSRCRKGNFTILEEQEELNNTQEELNQTEQIPENESGSNANSNATQIATMGNSSQKECIEGSLKDNKFCNISGHYENLRKQGQQCLTDYECESENCKIGLCKKAGILTRLLNWVSRLVGR